MDRKSVGRQAKQRLDHIAKPIDSLGLLEDMVVKLCEIQGNADRIDISKRVLVILCADHGVVDEGVTQTGREVTKVVSENFAKGCSSVNYMAKVAKADVYTIDVGINTERYPEKDLVMGAVIDRKIARGSGNIAREPAMTLEQCQKAIQIGMDLVLQLKEKGYQIIATGEMGIGNTTPTSALAALFLDRPAAEVTGKGAGLPGQKLQKKTAVIEQIVERVRKKGLMNGEKEKYALEILAEAGGYEIAAMAGVYLGGAVYHVPIIIDGAISAVAALVATHLDKRVLNIVLASHVSEEKTGQLALEALGVEAMIHGRMCLGEGTGAMTLLPLLDMAVSVYQNMGTFGEYDIDEYERFEE